eukprot:scaffold6222_cov50-Attheya_sp.AAC.2
MEFEGKVLEPQFLRMWVETKATLEQYAGRSNGSATRQTPHIAGIGNVVKTFVRCRLNPKGNAPWMYLQRFGIDPSQMGKGLHGFATGRILQMQRHVGTKFAQQSLINKKTSLLQEVVEEMVADINDHIAHEEINLRRARQSGSVKQAREFQTTSEFVVNYIRKTYEYSSDIGNALEHLQLMDNITEKPKLKTSLATNADEKIAEAEQFGTVLLQKGCKNESRSREA